MAWDSYFDYWILYCTNNKILAVLTCIFWWLKLNSHHTQAAAFLEIAGVENVMATNALIHVVFWCDGGFMRRRPAWTVGNWHVAGLGKLLLYLPWSYTRDSRILRGIVRIRQILDQAVMWNRMGAPLQYAGLGDADAGWWIERFRPAPAMRRASSNCAAISFSITSINISNQALHHLEVWSF